jgi:F0F1-type ATP synthase membrane subunit a
VAALMDPLLAQVHHMSCAQKPLIEFLLFYIHMSNLCGLAFFHYIQGIQWHSNGFDGSHVVQVSSTFSHALAVTAHGMGMCM